MKKFIGSLVLMILANTAQATGPRVTAALLSQPENEIFALDFPLVLTSENEDGGIAAALIKAAFQAEKTESTITPLPLQTMVSYYLNQENALAIVGHDLNLTPAELKNVITVPILILKESYFCMKTKQNTLNWQGKLETFKGLTIGVHKSDSSAVFDSKLGIKIEQDRLKVRIKSLTDEKIDLIRDADLVMFYMLSKKFPEQKNNIIRLEPSAGEAVINIAFNKKNPQGVAQAKRFQQGLKTLITNGKYQEIIKSHLTEGTFEQYFKPLHIK